MKYTALLFGVLLATSIAGCDEPTQSPVADSGPAIALDSTSSSETSVPPDDGVPFIDAELRTGDQGVDPSIPDAAPLPNVCEVPPPQPEQPPINLQARCRANGGVLKIRDLRDLRCQDAPIFRDGNGDGFSDERIDVELVNVVVSAVYEDSFAIQDQEGGAYSGLWVFTRNFRLDPDLQAGARINIRGSLMEYYTLTELQLSPENGEIEIISTGPPPTPVLVSDPSRIADGGDLTEALESVLVEVQNQRVTLTAPDCPRDFDMFVIEDSLRIEDEVELSYEPSRGDVLNSAIGVLHFSFNHQKIIPRSDDDIDWVYCGGEPDKCEPTDCVVDEDSPENGQMTITEIQDDPRGRDTGREFVELYNPSGDSINLDGWWLQNCADHRVNLSGRVSAGDTFVVAGSRNQGENGGFRADGLLEDFQISNGSGSLLLFNADSELVDQVRYSESGDWPDRETGDSLELRDIGLDNRLGTSWRSGRDQYGNGGRGTPGRIPR